MTEFQNKFRNESTRHPWWDYSWPGDYFITICLDPRKYLFGEIISGEMILSEIGKLADQEWQKTFAMRRSMNLSMGSYVVMPDHFHAILTLGKNEFNKEAPDVGILSNKEAINEFIEKNQLSKWQNKFGPQRMNLGSVIGGFKSSVQSKATKINPSFRWHNLYYDRIIRDQQACNQISLYIQNNINNWSP